MSVTRKELKLGNIDLWTMMINALIWPNITQITKKSLQNIEKSLKRSTQIIIGNIQEKEKAKKMLVSPSATSTDIQQNRCYMNELNIHNQTLPVNESTGITIQRGKHDKENPYVLISRKMLRDTSISPKAKGVLCYLLSLPDNWKAHPRHVAMALGVGKEQIYNILKELLNAGYATRTESKGEKGQFGFVLYEFYEDKLESPQIDKEKTTVSGNPDTDISDPGKRALRYKEHKNKLSKEETTSLKVPSEPEAAKAAEMENKPPPKAKREKSDFSPKVREVANQLINSLSRIKPDYVPPKNLTALLTEVDFILRLDKRDPVKLMDVFNWALSDSFWADKMFKPNPAKYLREKFDQLEMKMNAKPPVNPNQTDRRLREKDGSVSDAYKDSMF